MSQAALRTSSQKELERERDTSTSTRIVTPLPRASRAVETVGGPVSSATLRNGTVIVLPLHALPSRQGWIETKVGFQSLACSRVPCSNHLRCIVQLLDTVNDSLYGM